MSVARAGAFLFWASVRNRARRQIKRLREPKYLIASMVGIAYFWVFIRRALIPTTHFSRAYIPSAQLALSAFGLFTIVAAWLFGGDQGALQFTEAEVQFFFPAPARRRTLLHYKLVRTIVITAFSAGITTLFMGVRLTSHAGFFFIGAWLGLSILSMHLTAASLTRASLIEHGISGFRRRIATILVVASLAALFVFGAIHQAPFPTNGLNAASVSDWALLMFSNPLLAAPLLPILAPLRVAFAQTPSECLHALPPALVVLAVHYLWAVTSSVAFEEGSIAAAELRSQRVARWRGGQGKPFRLGKPLYSLSSRGRPELALLWKNLLAATRLASLRFVIVVTVLAVVCALIPFLVGEGDMSRRASIVGVLEALGAAWLAFFGPQLYRIDLRLDLRNIDLLRSYPLSGRSVVTAVLLAPALVLVAGEWLFLAAGTALALWFGMNEFGDAQDIAIVIAAAIVLPAMTWCGLVVHNAAALLFPAWISADMQGGRGVEVIGQRLLTFVGALVVLVACLVPASIPAAMLGWIIWHFAGWIAIPIGAICAATAMFFEMHLALGWLGRAYERFDSSSL